MTPPVTEPDPTIRYLTVPGQTQGRCPDCNGTGNVGNFCFPCCDSALMMIGTCPECEHSGPIGLRCQECNNADYEDELPGHCPQCHKCGVQGYICTRCEDSKITYE